MSCFIKSNKEYQRIVKNGKRISGRNVYAKFLFSEKEQFNYGVVVPKSICASAVKRNRLRRIFKEAVRSIKGTGAISVDIVFFPRKEPGKDAYNDARHFVEMIIERLGGNY